MLNNVVDRVRGWPKPLRIAAGVVLVLCGCVGFLPVLGFWMIPLGLALLAIDVPFLRPYVDRVDRWLTDGEAWIRRRLKRRSAAKP